jgi:anti-sigma factor RsiW
MSACPDYQTFLHGLIDGELDAANAVAYEKHLASCSACRAELESIERLREKLHAVPLRYKASDDLRKRIDSTIDAASRAPTRSSRLRTFFSAFKPSVWPSAVLAMAVALVFVLYWRPTQVDLTDEIVAGHVRSLQVNHLVDVETSDRHVVKPWFAGKVDFSPPVIDLSESGFALIGGRLDYLQDRAVVALAYHHRAHIINLFIWPANGDASPSRQTREGFNLIHWQTAGMAFWTVSDLNFEELSQFQAELAAHAPR